MEVMEKPAAAAAQQEMGVWELKDWSSSHDHCDGNHDDDDDGERMEYMRDGALEQSDGWKMQEKCENSLQLNIFSSRAKMQWEGVETYIYLHKYMIYHINISKYTPADLP